MGNVQLCTLLYTDRTLPPALPKLLPVEPKDFVLQILIYPTELLSVETEGLSRDIEF